jgi:hypothetical protein
VKEGALTGSPWFSRRSDQQTQSKILAKPPLCGFLFSGFLGANTEYSRCPSEVDSREKRLSLLRTKSKHRANEL